MRVICTKLQVQRLPTKLKVKNDALLLYLSICTYGLLFQEGAIISRSKLLQIEAQPNIIRTVLTKGFVMKITFQIKQKRSISYGGNITRP